MMITMVIMMVSVTVGDGDGNLYYRKRGLIREDYHLFLCYFCACSSVSLSSSGGVGA